MNISPHKISISLDTAFIFDIYSIMLNKIDKNLLPREEGEQFLCGIIHQLGFDKTNKIIESKEFEDLLNANSDTFDAVDLAREDRISAQAVDNLNTIRYQCKQRLQAKFFGTGLSEKKNI